jgi:glycerophosphoryl diester phosphodiesterase
MSAIRRSSSLVFGAKYSLPASIHPSIRLLPTRLSGSPLHLKRKYLGLPLLFLAGLYLFAAIASPEQKSLHPYFGERDFLVIAHRGGRGLGPEGTLPVFRRAVEMGADVLEMDVRVSADGALVIFHDARVDRSTDGTGRVDSLTLEQLRGLDVGFRWQGDTGEYVYRDQGLRILTLEEVLRAFPRRRMLLELKPEATEVARDLCTSVRAHDMLDRAVVASFHGEAMQTFRDACPEVATSASAGEVARYWLLHQLRLDNLYSADFQVFQVPERLRWIRLVDRRFVDRASARNLPVEVWTVNRREQMERLLDLGVDGIMTDHPDLLLELLRERNMR